MPWTGCLGVSRVKKLAALHLEDDAPVLYDLASSYGVTCPLAAFNHNGKKGKWQVNYGLLTNGRGTPVSVFRDNVGGTLGSQIDAMCQLCNV